MHVLFVDHARRLRVREFRHVHEGGARGRDLAAEIGAGVALLGGVGGEAEHFKAVARSQRAQPVHLKAAQRLAVRCGE